MEVLQNSYTAGAMQFQAGRSLIADKLDILVHSIKLFCREIPMHEIYGLKDKLTQCANSIDPGDFDSSKSLNRIDKIKVGIKIDGFLEECREYLNLIEKFRYADTSFLQTKIREIKDILINEYYLTQITGS